MSGGGGSSSSPSTQTQITDVPSWERGYLQDVLGQAQGIGAQPYQQFPGQQVAGFTPDQLSAFSQIQGLQSQYAPTQQSALDAATSGAQSANGIYSAGAGDINSSTGYNPLAAVAPFLGQATQYNSAAAGQPWLNQAAGYQAQAAQAGTPQGIQSYMSPYTNSVVQGIQDQANQNWTQNIMPGVNDKFVGSGQYGSGRNAQVLGQAAGNFQTGLSANVANALESGYNTAGSQAAQQAQLLSGLGSQALGGATAAGNLQNQQVGNLLNTAQQAGTAANQQAQNLQSAGTALGNLQATQGQQQLAAGNTLGNLSQQQQQTGVANAQALQAVGQQQQQLNQTNLDVAQQNWQNQANYPKSQTEWMADIIRGLPTAGAATTQQQTPAYSTSPLAALGGAGTTALSLSGSVNAKKKGGMIKGYATGGIVDDEDDTGSPLDALVDNPVTSDKLNVAALDDASAGTGDVLPDNAPMDSPANPLATPQPIAQEQVQQTPKNAVNPLDVTSEDSMDKPADGEMSKADMQRNQLLSIARGLLKPTYHGNAAEALGNAVGNLQDVGLDQNKWNAEQKLKREELDIKKEVAAQGKYTPVKDMFGNVTGALNTKTGEVIQTSGIQGNGPTGLATTADETPSADPQKAGMQILAETGTPFTPIASRQDITGRNAQAKAYRDAATGAKAALQQLNSLNTETGKYTPGVVSKKIYSAESSLGMGGDGSSARAEADKATKALANAFMAQNAGAKASGIRMLQFDADAVPNPDMPDKARSELITKNKAIANSQIQRAAISDMYPRMHLANVNAIMDAYEAKNPPLLENGTVNPKWMSYKDWLAKGRPNTAAMALEKIDKGDSPKPAMVATPSNGQPSLADLIAEKNRRQQQQ